MKKKQAWIALILLIVGISGIIWGISIDWKPTVIVILAMVLINTSEKLVGQKEE